MKKTESRVYVEEDSNYLDNLMEKQEKSRLSRSAISPNINSNIFGKLEKQYKKNLFMEWKESAYLGELLMSRRTLNKSRSASKKSIHKGREENENKSNILESSFLKKTSKQKEMKNSSLNKKQ